VFEIWRLLVQSLNPDCLLSSSPYSSSFRAESNCNSSDQFVINFTAIDTFVAVPHVNPTRIPRSQSTYHLVISPKQPQHLRCRRPSSKILKRTMFSIYYRPLCSSRPSWPCSPRPPRSCSPCSSCLSSPCPSWPCSPLLSQCFSFSHFFQFLCTSP
jgi:hypothetical protein